MPPAQGKREFSGTERGEEDWMVAVEENLK